jgi:membrane-associated phospholipid phosphatase
MLTNHRRAFLWSLLLLAACVLALAAVGRHPPEAAPQTTVPFVGKFDESMLRWMDDIRVTPLTWLIRVLNVVGGGLITIPLRAAATLVLIVRRRGWAVASFVATWATSEIALTVLKAWFHRGRPPGSLVTVDGYSFPSGHAVAGTATAVAIVLAFLPPGKDRRRWEWIAVGFFFVMAFSRVYLAAHWFSDVVAGVLLGAGIAVFWAAALTQIRDWWYLRQGRPVPAEDAATVEAPA